MSNQKKPRICEVLGVEVGEEFEIFGITAGLVRVSREGSLVTANGSAFVGAIVLASIINHPEKIIRKPKFTPDDMALMRHIRAVFGIGGLYRDDDGRLLFTDGNYTLGLPQNILHCIKIGEEMVELKQVLKEEDQCH